MAEVTLKKKVTLRKKNDSVAFNFAGKLKVKLFWQSDTDLDLCLFFKKKDGEVGGVFSNEYRSKKSDLGTLDKFPFMQHMGDNKNQPQVVRKRSRSTLPACQRLTPLILLL